MYNGKRTGYLTAMAAMLLAACASPPASGAPKWYRLHSSSFDLLTSAGEKKGRSLILYFEQVRRFFAAHMKTDTDGDTPPVHIVGFDSEKEFSPFQTGPFSKAFYNGGTRGDYIVTENISADSYPMAVHEYVHLLIRRSGFRAPPWWHEGLADLYSTLKTYGDRVEIGELPASRYALLNSRGAWLDVAELLAADQYSPLYNDARTTELFYAESWGLAHMLALSEQYKSRFGEFVERLKAGVPGEELFKTIYGKGAAQVQADLVAYVRQGARGRAQYPLRPGDTPPIEAAPATDLQVQITLADVLMGIDKRRQSAEILDHLSAQYPDSWEVEESLAYLSWYAADRDSARLHFRRAVDRGMRSSRGYLDYATLLGETGVASADLIPFAEKALEIQPLSRDARLRLASLYLSERKYEQAQAMIGKMGSLKPEESFQTYCLLAYAQIGLGNLDAARKSAENARPFAHTVTEKSEMSDLDRALRQQESAAGAPGPVAGKQASTGPTEKTGEISQGAPAEKHQIQGKLQRIDCFGDKLRLVFDVAGKSVALLILDPNAVTVKGKKTGTVAFYCGNQPDTPVSATYTPKPDAKLGTAGIITLIEFN